MSRPSAIGDGVKFLNRLLSGRMFGSRLGAQPFFPIFEYLTNVKHNGANTMINKRITDPAGMDRALVAAEKLLQHHDAQVQMNMMQAHADPLGLPLRLGLFTWTLVMSVPEPCTKLCMCTNAH